MDKNEVVIKLHDCRRYLEDKEWSDSIAGQYIEVLNNAIAILKEQETVKPECRIIFDVPYYFCGNCKTMLNMYAVKAKYCSNCGKQVKWE